MIALRTSLAALLALVAPACSELPGEILGTYKVTMALEENGCGAGAVFSLDKKRYAVELRAEAERGYWRIPGQTPIQGRYEAPDFAFEFHAVVATAGPDAGPNGCRLVQLDQVSGSLLSPDHETAHDAGEETDAEDDAEDDAEVEAEDDAEASEDEPAQAADAGVALDAGTVLEGEHLMTISAEPGTDCRRDALMPQGPFERLPCSVRYKLLGVPTKPF